METPDLNPWLQLGFTGLLYGLVIVFVIYGLFMAYHWFTYGASKKVAMTALAVYVTGGSLLFLTLSISLQYL